MTTPEIQPARIGDVIREVNESDDIIEDQYLRARIAHQAIQAKHPRRRGSRPRHLLIALAAIALDGVACYFAAEALGAAQNTTLLWAGAFLAVLAACEWALDHYYERSRRLCYLAAALGGELILTLGVLRYAYLLKTSPGHPLAAAAEAGLLAAATALLTLGGCMALRTAETRQAYRARRAARRTDS